MILLGTSWKLEEHLGNAPKVWWEQIANIKILKVHTPPPSLKEKELSLLSACCITHWLICICVCHPILGRLIPSPQGWVPICQL
jgi:hypothetical protein